MYIDRIDLIHFRNYERLSFRPKEGVNIFFGQNGSGKTNLLEAIHYCSLGKSHRISRDQNAVMIGEKEASVLVSVQGRYGRNEIEVRLRPGEEAVKSVWINQKKASRLSEMMGVLRCVIFSPEDLGLIREGPAIRRRFLDMMISQISRSYFIALQQYRVASSQRNAILRKAKMENSRPDSMIEDFEAAMAEYAVPIMTERIRYTEIMSRHGREIYRLISGKPDEELSVQYRASIREEGDPGSVFRRMLRENREEDMRQGNAGSGPHRDDLNLLLNQKNMKQYASQGQTRTAALSLKMAQCRMYDEITGEHPVLLLDDVMSELDLVRRENLLRILDRIQTFITCSDEGDLAGCQDHSAYRVTSRDGRAHIMEAWEEEQKHPVVFHEPDFS